MTRPRDADHHWPADARYVSTVCTPPETDKPRWGERLIEIRTGRKSCRDDLQRRQKEYFDISEYKHEKAPDPKDGGSWNLALAKDLLQRSVDQLRAVPSS